MSKNNEKYSDFSTVKKMKNALIPEEFPEGAFGSPIGLNDPVFSKSSPWQKEQFRESAYVFPYKELHDDLPRQTPGAHPIHDEDNEQPPES